MADIGSKTSITDLMKLRRALITILVLPESLFYFSQNLVSCKYLLPRDEISMQLLILIWFQYYSEARRIFYTFLPQISKNIN